MGAALSIFVLLSVSVFVVQLASVALRITGLSEDSARFQALSAFTGTGFTTVEAEIVVNYPVRRWIASMLMIVGNMGFVSVFATLVVSLVRTDGEPNAVVIQLAWLLGGLGLLWFLMLNRTADRLLCSVIERLLNYTTLLGERGYQRLVQVGDGYSVCEHTVTPQLLTQAGNLAVSELAELGLTVLTVRARDGGLVAGHRRSGRVCKGDTLVVYGADAGHEILQSNSECAGQSQENATLEQGIQHQ